MNDIAGALDGMGAGRASLAVLLHSPDARVRASTGAYLIKLMPDRVLPILREIEEGKGAVVPLSMRIGRFSAGSMRTKCAASRPFQNLIFIVSSASKARDILRENVSFQFLSLRQFNKINNLACIVSDISDIS